MLEGSTLLEIRREWIIDYERSESSTVLKHVPLKVGGAASWNKNKF